MADTESENGTGGSAGESAESTVPLSTIYERFQAWRDYCASRKQCGQQRVLGPDEEAEWFNLPKVTPFGTVNAGDVVAKADPLRVYLAFATGPNAGLLRVSPRPEDIAGAYALPPTTAVFELFQFKHGSLVGQQWHVNDTITTVPFALCVIELTLKEWPVAQKG